MFKKTKRTCNRSPKGWVCKLERDHEGPCPLWPIKQALASPARYYGDGGTIHNTGYVDVEVNDEGKVVQVWYRCQLLPFKQHDSNREYHNPNISIHGMEILDEQ